MIATPNGWHVAGHDEVVRQLQGRIAAHRVGHAYLFVGPDGIGKTTVALEFARALLCLERDDGIPCGECGSCRRIHRDSEKRSHPDVTLADIEWQTALLGNGPGGARQRLSIEAIRWLRQDIVSRPVLSRWKVQIVDVADRLSDSAPDAFLKTLEEPPGSAVIILVATSLEVVPETVRSRCQHVQLGVVPTPDIEAALVERGTEPGEARSIATMARGRIATAFALTSDPEALERRGADLQEAFGFISEPLGRLRLAGPIAANHTKDRDRTFSLLDHCAGLWRDALLVHAGLVDQLAHPELAAQLERFSGQFSTEQITTALRATRRATHDLDRNFQARIALMAMINQWPVLHD